MKDLNDFLSGVGKVTPSRSYREAAMTRVMYYVNNTKSTQFSIIDFLKDIKYIRTSEYMRSVVKSRIIASIKNKKSLLQNFGDLFLSILLKGLLIPTLIASMFFVFVIGVNVTSAEFESRVVLSKGNVHIKHVGGNWKKISSSEVIGIGDLIKTDSNSVAEIYYHNDSMTRVFENSVISISSITSDPYSNLPIILKIKSGNIWNQIISSDYDFQVETGDVFVSTRKGAFYVKKNLTTKVVAVSQAVDVKIIDKHKIAFSSKLAAGFGIQTKDEQDVSGNIRPNKASDDKWTIENQIADKEYKQKLISKINSSAIKKVSILPNNKLYFAKKEFENIVNEIAVDVIKKRLQELKVLIINGTNGVSEESIAIIDKLKGDLSKEEKNELAIFLDNEIDSLNIILPGDGLYKYKLYISKLILSIDTIGYVKDKIMLDLINEVQEVSKSTNNRSNLLVALNNFVSVGSNFENKEKGRSELKKSLSLKNDILFTLKSLESSLDKSDNVIRVVRKEKTKVASEIKKITREVYPDLYKDQNNKGPSINDSTYFVGQVNDFLGRLDKYKSEQGKENTLYWMLDSLPCDKNNLEFLYSLKEKVDGGLSVIVSKSITKTLRCIDKKN